LAVRFPPGLSLSASLIAVNSYHLCGRPAIRPTFPAVVQPPGWQTFPAGRSFSVDGVKRNSWIAPEGIQLAPQLTTLLDKSDTLSGV
jgi:hypothetical protein